VVSFDNVADEYAAGRPGYPDDVFDALEPLAGQTVLEGGAGTGIATRGLIARGATVMPFDIGRLMLQKAAAGSTDLTPVLADGARLPFVDECADLVCFAQSWHWLDPDRRAVEMARVLRDNGRWAAWWSHARGDGEPWFDEYWDRLEDASSGVSRDRRDLDWGADLGDSELFDVGARLTFPWTRTLPIEQWLLDDRSRSFVSALEPLRRDALIAGIQVLLDEHFPDGEVVVPYETWLWMAEKR
jgi:SAM-dependent methyltransferase